MMIAGAYLCSGLVVAAYILISAWAVAGVPIDASFLPRDIDIASMRLRGQSLLSTESRIIPAHKSTRSRRLLADTTCGLNYNFDAGINITGSSNPLNMLINTSLLSSTDFHSCRTGRGSCAKVANGNYGNNAGKTVHFTAPSQTFTISFWQNLKEFYYKQNLLEIIDASHGYIWMNSYWPGDNYFYWQDIPESTAVQMYNRNLFENKWALFTFVYTPDNIAIYVNDVLKNNIPNNIPNGFKSVSPSPSIFLSGGYYDDLNIFYSALTPSQVASVYNYGYYTVCNCPDGTYASSGSCAPCPMNKFCSNNATFDCPLNSFSSSGASSIADCKCATGLNMINSVCTCPEGNIQGGIDCTMQSTTICGNGKQCAYSVSKGTPMGGNPVEFIFSTNPCSGLVVEALMFGEPGQFIAEIDLGNVYSNLYFSFLPGQFTGGTPPVCGFTGAYDRSNGMVLKIDGQICYTAPSYAANVYPTAYTNVSSCSQLSGRYVTLMNPVSGNPFALGKLIITTVPAPPICNAQCSQCPSNKYCPLGSTAATPCPTNTISKPGSSLLSQCEVGQILVDLTIDGASLSANQSQFQRALPSDVTLDSYTDSIVVTDGSCPKGYYCPADSTTAVACPSGTYNDLTNAVAVGDCKPCPPGEFCPTASPQPTACAAGSYRIMPLGTAQSDCDVCPVGQYCPIQSVTPTDCSAGTYQIVPGSTDAAACLACPAGKYCTLTSAAPTSCQAGTYRSTTGAILQSDCSTCPAGNYCPEASVDPTKCSAGTYEPVEAAKAVEECLACPAGEYCPIATVTPTACSAGSYRATTGATKQDDCAVCTAGNYCPVQSINPTNCAAGSYNPSTGSVDSSACQSCPQADYCPSGTATPMQCAADTYALGGAPVCTHCPSYASSPVASTSCTCVNGHYQVGSVTGGGASVLAETVGGVDTYLSLTSLGANKLSYVTLNGFSNVSVLQGASITLSSTPYNGASFAMNVYSQLYNLDSHLILMQAIDASYSGMYLYDFVPFTRSFANSAQYIYSTGVTGAGTASLTWDTTNTPPGLYYVMATTGGVATEHNGALIFVASSTPSTFNAPVMGAGTVTTMAAIGDSIVFSSGGATVKIWSYIKADSTWAADPVLEASGSLPFTWSSDGVSLTKQYYATIDSNDFNVKCYIVLVARPTAASSPYLNCPNCTAGTFSLAGAADCTNCGLGSYSAEVSAACTTCPTGTKCDSETTPAPVNCGLGNYQGSTGQSFCSTCPANQYCKSLTTAVPANCPTHTSSLAGSGSILQCRCDQGFTCSYTKRITAVVTLNTTATDFNNDLNGVKTSFISAVANAAGVAPSQVTINTVTPAVPTGNRRRLLGMEDLGAEDESARTIHVHTFVHGADRLEDLDGHFIRLSAPTLHRAHSWEESHSVHAREEGPETAKAATLSLPRLPKAGASMVRRRML